jgi:hypothetical protein
MRNAFTEIKICEDPTAETAGRQKLNIYFQCHPGLSRILLLSERFPTSGNDNHETLLMNSIVSEYG